VPGNGHSYRNPGSEEGAHAFATIRSYLSTLRKQSVDPYQALVMNFRATSQCLAQRRLASISTVIGSANTRFSLHARGGCGEQQNLLISLRHFSRYATASNNGYLL
jgi:hypothetical protein